ncbi:unnamed protein product [Rotaria magnacalcarata]
MLITQYICYATHALAWLFHPPSHKTKFIPVSTTCYDDPTKDHSGPAISTVVPDSQMHFKACSFYLLNVRDIVDDAQMGEVVLQKNVHLGSAELRLLAIVGLQAIHLCDQPDVVVLSNDSGKIRDT